MSLLRILFRVPALALLTGLSVLGVVLVRPLRAVVPGAAIRGRNAVMRFWGRAFARLAGMRMTVEGEPPAGSFYLVANHLSYMDIILLAAQVSPAFVAKADLRGWPLIGLVIAASDAIFIDRERRKDVVRVMDVVGDKMQLGLGVVLFPEGTSSRGDSILRFRPSLLQYPASNDIPVYYAALSYSTPNGGAPPSETVCWWGDAPFVPHVLKLLALPRFDARLVYGDKPLQDDDRKRLATRLHGAMSSCFAPMS